MIAHVLSYLDDNSLGVSAAERCELALLCERISDKADENGDSH